MSTNEPPVGPDPIEPNPQDPSAPNTPPPPPSEPPSWGSFDAGDASTPPPPPPPTGGSYGGAAMPYSPTDAISFGWQKFSANVGQWLIAGLLVVAVSILFGVFSYVVEPSADPYETNPFASMFSIPAILINFVSTLATYLLSAYFYRGALDEAEGRKFDIGSTMSRVPLGPALLTSLLVSVGTTIGMILCFLPGIIFGFLAWFSLLFVIDKGLDPIAAITASINLIWKNIGQTLLFGLLAIVVIIAGACLCGLGLFVAYPVTLIATAYTYKKLQNEPVAS